MPQPLVEKAHAFEGAGLTLLARVYDNTATAILQAGLSAIVYSVIDTTTGTAVTGHDGASLTISSVVYDTLQTGAIWTKDSTGYNFRTTLAATALPDAGRIYRIEVKFTPTSGPVFFAVWDVTSVGLYTT